MTEALSSATTPYNNKSSLSQCARRCPLCVDRFSRYHYLSTRWTTSKRSEQRNYNVFCLRNPAKYSGLKVSCQGTKIERNDPDAPNWDDTMKQFVQRNPLNPNVIVPPSEEKTAKNTSRKFPDAGK